MLDKEEQNPSLLTLREPYVSFLKEERWDEYIGGLCRDALTWWFNMDTPAIASHFMPLSSLSPENNLLPLRIAFFSEAIKPAIPLDHIEYFYQRFKESKDREAMCAAVGAGVASIWDSGTNYKRYSLWYKRIDELLKLSDKLSPLALSSIHGFKGLAELTGHGNMSKTLQSYGELRRWAEEARSPSLRLFYAAAASYCLLWMGRINEAAILLNDAEALSGLPETSTVCSIYFKTTRGLFHTVSGNPEKGKDILLEIINLPFFEMLPPPAYFLSYGHLLYALSCMGDSSSIDEIAAKVRKRAIPEQNYFHHSYLHFNLGIAYLGIGQPKRAFLHSNEAIERGRKSESPIAENMPALLRSQCLSDLGKTDEALKLLLKWMDRWRQTGFIILAAAGAIEISALYLKRGEIGKARHYFDSASQLLPQGEPTPRLYRKPEFFKNLEKALFPSETHYNGFEDHDNMPVSINAFGDLKIKIGNTIIYDRNWRGDKIKTLLKALIVFGGTKVSSENLSEILWPDAEGDKALNNLKIALHRLRRLGVADGKNPIPWIQVKDKGISLVKPLCSVDSILFKEMLDRSFRECKDVSRLKMALDLYSDDLLMKDCFEIWIIRHRELLKKMFIKAVILFSELSMESGSTEEALPYINKAVTKDQLDERLYILLMRSYIKVGYPAKALHVFKSTKSTLKKELGIEPCNELIELAKVAGNKK